MSTVNTKKRQKPSEGLYTLDYILHFLTITRFCEEDETSRQSFEIINANV